MVERPKERVVAQSGHHYNTRSQGSRCFSKEEGVERFLPLGEVPVGGAQGGIGFVNAPVTGSEGRSFKKELKPLVEDPTGVAEQIDQFLGPST